MCISWTIKGLISLMHGITMKVSECYLTKNPECKPYTIITSCLDLWCQISGFLITAGSFNVYESLQGRDLVYVCYLVDRDFKDKNRDEI